jgi:hypothetical protein
MRFETQSGSIYEVDETNKQARRVYGMYAGTERLGTDGNWRSYSDITSPIVVGQPVMIVWGTAGNLNSDFAEVVVKTTLTSVVVAVGELN